MLYDRWRALAKEFHDQWAVLDLPSGRRWTFAALAAAADSRPAAGAQDFVCPQGSSVEFIFSVLTGWRDGCVVCPLESGQRPPVPGQVPPGCVHLKTTSATTGPSRAVAFSAAQLMADADNIVTGMDLRRDRPNLAVISLAHSYGFSNLVLPLLLHGVPLILGRGSLPETVRRGAAVAPRITLAGVPALWRAWLDADAIPSNVGLAISAGAPLPLGLEAAVCERTGIKIHNFYGSTECGGIAFDSSATPRTDAACLGEALPNVTVVVGADGCLEVRGPAVGLAYWPESDERLAAGRFTSSDLVEFRRGQMFLRGRAGDQINVAGRKVAPELIECALLAHPQVRECLVFGVPSGAPERVEDIAACVVPRDPSLTPGELRSFLARHLISWQVPRDWWFVDSLQTNERGKLSRTEWRQRYLTRAG